MSAAMPVSAWLWHGWRSAAGILRGLLRHPAFTLRLAGRRVRYAVLRDFSGGLQTPDGLIIDSPDMLISYWSMFVERELWHRSWVDHVRRASTPLVVDVGANAGVFGHLVFSLNPSARVLAFDPHRSLVDKMNAYATRCGRSLVARRCAVSDREGSVLLALSRDGDTGARVVDRGAGTPAGTMEVDAVTLDGAIAPGQRIALLKIDVEGHEEVVLRGARRCRAAADLLIVEVHGPMSLAGVRRELGAGWSAARLGPSDYLLWQTAAATDPFG